MNPIEQAMAAAKANQAAASTALTPTAPASGAVSVATPPPQKLSMDNMQGGGLAVDKWFKVTEDGVKIGDSKLIVGDIFVTLDMTEGVGFMLKYSIKGGNPAQYASSYDLATASGGGSWADAQARIRALDPRAAPYRCVDLPMTLTTDLSDMSKAVVGKAGDVIGYSTSTTNWANWQAFYNEVKEAGLLGQTVTAKVTAQSRSNKNNNVWGVMKWELQQAE